MSSVLEMYGLFMPQMPHTCEQSVVRPALVQSTPTSLPSMERREERDREGEREERERDIKGKRKKKMIILNKGNSGHLCFTVDQAAKDKRITEQ